MSDILDTTGLTLKTLTEIREELVSDLQTIYGNDINVDQNSQDGQSLNIYAQGGIDLREILQKIYSSFDPDQAEGVILDQRVAINGIMRNGGTYTFQPVSITTDRALNLIGLDDQSAELNPTVENLYTVKDDAGTEFYLLDSYSFVAAGTQSLLFRAADIGKVETTLNTITTPVTVLAGVTGINNPLASTTIGIVEETDAQLKARRRASTALPANGYLDSIQAALSNLDGVTTAKVYENDTNVTDGDGTEAHTIWAIVEGGADADIAEIIYKKKSAGAGMRGSEIIEVPRRDGRTYEAKFDRPGSEDLYIRFSLTLKTGGFIDDDNIKLQIVNGLFWEVGGDAGADDIIDFLKNINTDYRITGCEVSKNGSSWADLVSVTSPANRFVNDISRITIS